MIQNDIIAKRRKAKISPLFVSRERLVNLGQKKCFKNISNVHQHQFSYTQLFCIRMELNDIKKSPLHLQSFLI